MKISDVELDNYYRGTYEDSCVLEWTEDDLEEVIECLQ